MCCFQKTRNSTAIDYIRTVTLYYVRIIRQKREMRESTKRRAKKIIKKKKKQFKKKPERSQKRNQHQLLISYYYYSSYCLFTIYISDNTLTRGNHHYCSYNLHSLILGNTAKPVQSVTLSSFITLVDIFSTTNFSTTTQEG